MSKSLLQSIPSYTDPSAAKHAEVVPEPGAGFVLTPVVKDLTERALTYLGAGYSIHFSGPAGTGKTTLAFHVAAQLGRPVSLIHGDDEFGSSDLVGRDAGFHKFKVVDNYVHQVMKTEEQMSTLWVDNRLTTACELGHILIYDEFTRSRPETNNALLSVLGERVLNLPNVRRDGAGYLDVHPDFRAIFTSNPEEYAGVHKTQDALLDRVITLNVDHYERATEIAIVQGKTGIKGQDAILIVDIIRELRTVGVNNHRPTIRAAIAIGKILAYRGIPANPVQRFFRTVCHDVFNMDTLKVTREGQSLMPEVVDEIIDRVGRKPGYRPQANNQRRAPAAGKE
ncbi:gas vesicle protein GvpN [Candidatus Thiosymbion oneisti]|uniref:gas vesicle protein GvpN n=1 Tax=Candidatus Thiosymbion oneisti TaxID=589554 RepID=UPI000AE0383F|nr:gas vesicle protein GvpN [Candidatus Thiosymbion oneisti]